MSKDTKGILSIDYSSIGKRIRYYRNRAGMSQGDLASALFISSSNYISRLETGKDAPSLELIINMAHLFQIRTDDLLTDESIALGTSLSSSGLPNDCPQEIRPLLNRIMTAIQGVLMAYYRK